MDVDPGLCETCRHLRLTVSKRGSRFYRCNRSRDDPRFAKYPRLPVLRCAGYGPDGAASITGRGGGRDDS